MTQSSKEKMETAPTKAPRPKKKASSKSPVVVEDSSTTSGNHDDTHDKSNNSKNKNKSTSSKKCKSSSSSSLSAPCAAWEKNYAKMVTYHAKFGHCNCKRKDSFDPKLGVCVEEWRRNQEKLSEDHKLALNKLGFVWKPLEHKWNVMFEKLQQQHHDGTSSKGDSDHNEKDTTTARSENNNDLKLSSWITTQRNHSKQGRLREDRKKKLESIGFDFNVPNKRKTRACTTSGSSKGTATTTRSKKTPTAVVAARAPDLKNGYNDNNDDDEKDNDENENDPRNDMAVDDDDDDEATWQKHYQNLLLFHQTHKHCNAPNETVLAKWTNTQRRLDERGQLSQDRKELIHQIGGFVKGTSTTAKIVMANAAASTATATHGSGDVVGGGSDNNIGGESGSNNNNDIGRSDVAKDIPKVMMVKPEKRKNKIHLTIDTRHNTTDDDDEPVDMDESKQETCSSDMTKAAAAAADGLVVARNDQNSVDEGIVTTDDDDDIAKAGMGGQNNKEVTAAGDLLVANVIEKGQDDDCDSPRKSISMDRILRDNLFSPKPNKNYGNATKNKRGAGNEAFFANTTTNKNSSSISTRSSGVDTQTPTLEAIGGGPESYADPPPLKRLKVEAKEWKTSD